jgi:hypothetical protein
LKRYSITVRGRRHLYNFDVYGRPEWVEGWRADGLEVEEIVNTVPESVAALGFTHLWIFFQDIFYFRNPFKT